MRCTAMLNRPRSSAVSAWPFARLNAAVHASKHSKAITSRACPAVSMPRRFSGGEPFMFGGNSSCNCKPSASTTSPASRLSSSGSIPRRRCRPPQTARTCCHHMTGKHNANDRGLTVLGCRDAPTPGRWGGSCDAPILIIAVQFKPGDARPAGEVVVAHGVLNFPHRARRAARQRAKPGDQKFEPV